MKEKQLYHKINLASNEGINEVVVAEQDGYLLYEGDIIIGKASDLLTPPLDPKVGVIIDIPENRKWPDGILVYDIHPSLKNDARISNAIKHWELNTRITFKQTNDSKSNHVYFKPGNECSSYVGMIGGRQDLILHENCALRSVIHEIGHALGLWHEQSRLDRDQYIKIHWGNIDESKKHNFNKHMYDGEMYGDYDYESIMHYSAYAFAIDRNKKTIEVLNGSVDIGKTKVLSKGDISIIQNKYFPEEFPCGDTPCEMPSEVEIAQILHKSIKQPYSKNYHTDIDKIVLKDDVIKTKELTIGKKKDVLINLNRLVPNEKNYNILIIDTLVIENSTLPPDLKHHLVFKWDRNEIHELHDKLKGANGNLVRPISQRGKQGPSGLTGKKGKTKYAPTIFLFIKNIKVLSGNINKIKFSFDLDGIPGANGGQGGLGGDGTKGVNGRDAWNGPYPTCRRGGRSGGSGGSPGKGGRGGDAGCGGNGGRINLYTNDIHIWEILYRSDISVKGFGHGKNYDFPGGKGGRPGAAGKPGAKGERGANAGNCSSVGDRGVPGKPSHGSSEWRKWNLGNGEDSSYGEDGFFQTQLLDNITNLVFNNK